MCLLTGYYCLVIFMHYLHWRSSHDFELVTLPFNMCTHIYIHTDEYIHIYILRAFLCALAVPMLSGKAPTPASILSPHNMFSFAFGWTHLLPPFTLSLSHYPSLSHFLVLQRCRASLSKLHDVKRFSCVSCFFFRLFFLHFNGLMKLKQKLC